ncbi:unnamed protein product [Mycena citricolor]|uniref:Uncharacterized protein n=1 Tax=Mycena citricolor TaxID=2018698 RepID=A0AAD2K4M5_9AGAR|nr:unnamed protein product [Mycena citricolor]
MAPGRPNSTLPFGNMLSKAMVALNLRDSRDEYKKVSSEEDGQVAMFSEPSGYQEQQEDAGEAVGLMGGAAVPIRHKRKSGICVWYGTDCSLFWKAFGIILAILAVWSGFRLIRWAVAPRRSGLEKMPAFSTSLGCVGAHYVYKGVSDFHVPISSQFRDHSIDIHGGAKGTITVLQGAPSDVMVRYEVNIRTDNKDLLTDLEGRRVFSYPTGNSDGTAPESRLRISTPYPKDGACMRYDVKMFIPPTLKKLNIASHTVTHVQFDPDSDIQIEDLILTLFTVNPNNMVLPHNSFKADRMSLEVIQGWIVGDVSISSSTKLGTQRGNGVINVRAHPTPATGPGQKATLQTLSGVGRTDVFYVEGDKTIHRPISALHISSMQNNVYLNYRESNFKGRIELSAPRSTITGQIQRLTEGVTQKNPWTHWFGDQHGEDELVARSLTGWVGMYFEMGC